MSAGFTDLGPIRENWRITPKAQQDSFLFEMVTMLVGEGIVLMPATPGSGINWPAIRSYAATTSAKNKLLLSGAISMFTFVGGIALFFFISPWWLAALIFVGVNYWATFPNNFHMTRSAVIQAAMESSDTFSELWSMGAFAIEIPRRHDMYSVTPNGTQWQDVVLLALGWEEQIGSIPVGRKQLFNNTLDALSAVKRGAPQ